MANKKNYKNKKALGTKNKTKSKGTGHINPNRLLIRVVRFETRFRLIKLEVSFYYNKKDHMT